VIEGDFWHLPVDPCLCKQLIQAAVECLAKIADFRHRRRHHAQGGDRELRQRLDHNFIGIGVVLLLDLLQARGDAGKLPPLLRQLTLQLFLAQQQHPAQLLDG
jgi:hypothetical protein